MCLHSNTHPSGAGVRHSCSPAVQVNPFHREVEIVLRDLKISTMSNITVVSRSEKTDVTSKLVIENVLSELKEAKNGSSFNSDVFYAEDFAFQLEIYLNGDRERYEHCISTFINNRTGEPVLLTNVCFELKAIPPNSTETVMLARNMCNEMKIWKSDHSQWSQGRLRGRR